MIQSDSPSTLLSDTLLTRLLENAPEVHVPAAFAARVRAELPSFPRRQASQSAGRTVALLCAALIAAGLFVVAAHLQPNTAGVGFWIELLLLLELGAIAYWLAVKQTFAG